MGFFGFGKIIFVNRIFYENYGKKIVVIVNEFGEISIDGQLVIRDEQVEFVEFNNGCFCCMVRGDLIEMFERFQECVGEFEGILIEMIGFVDFVLVVFMFFVVDDVKSCICFDVFVIMVDVVNLEINFN